MSRLPVPSPLRRARRVVLARRRPLAALCAALAVLATVQANAAGPPPRTLVVTAAHDLGAGVVVRAEDLHTTAFDPDSVPTGIVPRVSVAVGRTTTGPVRAGEPLTDARLLTTSLLDGFPGLVAAPVRIGDPGAVRLLQVGDRVTLLAADPQGGSRAAVVGRDVPVVAIPHDTEDAAGITSGALVVVALPDDAVRRVAAASVSSYLSVALTR